MGSIVAIFFLFHPMITKRSLQLFSCFNIEGESWLSDDLNVRCWEGDHETYVMYASIPSIAVWIVSFPLICLVFLLSNKAKLDKINRRLVMGFLYHGFKKDYFYWEFIIIYRKVIVILIIVFEAQLNAMLQGLLIILIIFLSFSL